MTTTWPAKCTPPTGCYYKQPVEVCTLLPTHSATVFPTPRCTYSTSHLSSPTTPPVPCPLSYTTLQEHLDQEHIRIYSHLVLYLSYFIGLIC